MKRLILPLILLLALGLRLYGIDFPSHHPDEKHVVKMALHMLKEGTLEPQKMYYGSLTLYLQAAAIGLFNLIGGALGQKPLRFDQALVVARVLSTLASVATVLLTAKLVQAALRGTTTPLERPVIAPWFAPLFMAVAFISIQCAHYATVDSLMACFATAAVVMALRAYDDGARRHFLLAGLFAGFATATKYTGALSALPLALIPLVTLRRPRPLRETFTGLVCVGLGFLIAMPFALIRFPKFMRALRFEANHYKTGGETIFAMGPDTFQWNLEFLYYTGVGPGLALMALLGLLWLSSRWGVDRVPLPDWRRTLLLLIYPFVAFLFVSRYMARFDRNLLPVLPFMAMTAALYAEAVWQAMRLWRPRLGMAALATALSLSLAYPLMRGVVFDWQVKAPHTKDQLGAWRKTLPRSAKLKSHDQYLAKTLGDYQREGYDYLVMSSHSLEPVAAFPDRYPRLARTYPEILAGTEVVKVFRNPWFDSDFFAPHHLLNSATVNIYHGPTLMVLRVPKLPGIPVTAGNASSPGTAGDTGGDEDGDGAGGSSGPDETGDD